MDEIDQYRWELFLQDYYYSDRQGLSSHFIDLDGLGINASDTLHDPDLVCENAFSFNWDLSSACSDQSWSQDDYTSPRSSQDPYGSSSSATSTIWTTASRTVLQEGLSQEPEELSPFTSPVEMTFDGNPFYASLPFVNDSLNDMSRVERHSPPRQCSAGPDIQALLQHGLLCGSRGERRAMCICRKIFRGQYALSNLQRHVREERHLSVHGRLPCSHCDTTFKRADNLHQHCLRCHPDLECCHCRSVAASRGTSDYRCDACDISFSKLDDYNRHMENRHGPQDGTIA